MTSGLVGWPGTRPLTSQPWVPDLDLNPTIGQVVSSIVFNLIDRRSGQNLGTITPIRPGSVLNHDTTRTIKRELRLQVGTADMAEINSMTDEILPVMTMGGVDYELGRYVFTDDQASVTTRGDLGGETLMDEMWIVDQKLDRGFSSSGAVPAAVLEVCRGLPIPGIEVDPSPYLATGAWSPGAFRGAEVLNSLATQGDYETPWMANSGKMRMIRTVRESEASPTFDFDTPRTVIRSRLVRTSDLLTAPNRWTVTANGGEADDAAITATFDVPAAAPHSIANRGFVISEVLSMQLSTPGQAAAIAAGLAARAAILSRFDLETPPDPRHDSYDVILWQGVKWVETAWSMQLDPGGTMTHTLRRSFQ